jgi:hypothetical protein
VLRFDFTSGWPAWDAWVSKGLAYSFAELVASHAVNTSCLYLDTDAIPIADLTPLFEAAEAEGCWLVEDSNGLSGMPGLSGWVRQFYRAAQPPEWLHINPGDISPNMGVFAGRSERLASVSNWLRAHRDEVLSWIFAYPSHPREQVAYVVAMNQTGGHGLGRPGWNVQLHWTKGQWLAERPSEFLGDTVRIVHFSGDGKKNPIARAVISQLVGAAS